MNRLLAKPLGLEAQDKLISVALKEILARCQPKKIILFGSAGRGEMTAASDLDFVVVMATAAEAQPAQKSLNSLSRILDWPVDCLVVDEQLFAAKSQVGGVYFVAADEGKVLWP